MRIHKKEEIEVKTNDQRVFMLPEKTAFRSSLLRNVCASTACTYPIPLMVSSAVFEIVHKFMKIDTSLLCDGYNPLEIKFRQTDFNFFMEHDNKTLLEVCNAANYLEYPYLLELCCKIISGKMKYKNARELREFIGLESDMTEEELANIDREFGWMSSDE